MSLSIRTQNRPLSSAEPMVAKGAYSSITVKIAYDYNANAVYFSFALRRQEDRGRFCVLIDKDTEPSPVLQLDETKLTSVDSISYGYGDTEWKDLLTSFDGATITYDAIGNPLTYGTTAFTWEHGRQLASMTKNDVQWTYTYSNTGLRTSRSNGSTTYKYVYDGSILKQMTIVNEIDKTEKIVGFTYDATGSPLTMTYDGETYYYITNMQGDVVGMLDDTGARLVTYSYTAYGQEAHSTDNTEIAAIIAAVNPLGYRGYVMDMGTSLYYCQSRYYDPAIGRFINADTYPATGQGLTGNNMFAYCGNNPVNRIDTSGEAWLHWVAAVAIVAIAAVAVVATAGSAAAAVVAVTSVAHGVAAATTASTVAAGVFVGTSTALAASTIAATMESSSLEEFADFGEGALLNTVTGGVTGGIDAYSMAKQQNTQACNSTKNNCFVEGTLVLTDNGTVPIETVTAGDMVWAWDEKTGDVALKEVVETYVNETDELVHIYVNGEKITTTPSHPFYSPVKGWTDAVRLRAGDILVLVNGEYVVVEKVQHEMLEKPIEVYNFQVKDYHTYYVADAGVLVHNVCVSQDNPGATGQAHHPISKGIEKAASSNSNLNGVVTRKGWGTIRAGKLSDHVGYQKWHRNFDNATINWLNNHNSATVADFVEFMNKLYGSKVAQSRFGYVWFKQ